MAISAKQRRWLLGIALSLTVAAAASVGNNDDDADATVVAAQARHREVRSREADGVASSAGLMLDRLKRPALPEDDVKDMFKAKSWYVPPPAPRVAPRPVAPPLPFVYIGKMQEQGSGYVVFLERQNRIFAVKDGDAIDADYRVDSINVPSMTLTYLPLDIKQTLQIGEAN